MTRSPARRARPARPVARHVSLFPAFLLFPSQVQSVCSTQSVSQTAGSCASARLWAPCIHNRHRSAWRGMSSSIVVQRMAVIITAWSRSALCMDGWGLLDSLVRHARKCRDVFLALFSSEFSTQGNLTGPTSAVSHTFFTLRRLT